MKFCGRWLSGGQVKKKQWCTKILALGEIFLKSVSAVGFSRNKFIWKMYFFNVKSLANIYKKKYPIRLYCQCNDCHKKNCKIFNNQFLGIVKDPNNDNFGFID